MFEILTWRMVSLHDKPVVIFNYEGYWDPLLRLLENIMGEGFASSETSAYYHVVTDLGQIMTVLGI